MKNLIFASFVMLACVFCSCGNNQNEKSRAEELTNCGKKLRLVNEKLEYYYSTIARQDTILAELKDKILNPKLSKENREAYLDDYGERMEMRFPSSARVMELETEKSNIQRMINKFNPTFDEKVEYGLKDYLK